MLYRATLCLIPFCLALTACEPTGVVLTPPEQEDMATEQDSGWNSWTPDMRMAQNNNPTEDMGTPPNNNPMPDMGQPDMNMPNEDMGTPDMNMPTGDYFTTYPAGPVYSPMTEHVVKNMRAIAQKGPNNQINALIKVGDSHTVSTNFLRCFEGNNINLDGRDHLQSAINYYSGFARESLAAKVGMSAGWAITGSPSPLQQEMSALNPRFATLNYGTNDIQARNIYTYANNMLDIVDQLIAKGTIPILSSIPVRGDSADANSWVPRFNAVAWAIAQSRQVPFVDVWQDYLKIPGYGLAGDNLHLNVLGAGRGCVFTSEGLNYGNNVRNLHHIEMLANLEQTIGRNEDVFDPPPPQRQGSGAPNDPFVIAQLPYADLQNTSNSPHDQIDSYACSPSTNESGPELHYRLELTQQTNLRVMLFDRGQVDADLHLLDASANPQTGCIDRDHELITQSLAPGTYHLVVDSFVSSSGAVRDGEYLLVILAE